MASGMAGKKKQSTAAAATTTATSQIIPTTTQVTTTSLATLAPKVTRVKLYPHNPAIITPTAWQLQLELDDTQHKLQPTQYHGAQ